MFNSSGWLQSLSGSAVTHRETPNKNTRPPGCDISLLVIHNISLPPGEFGGGYVQKFFNNQLDPNEHPYFKTIAELKVSSHFLIERTGHVWQFASIYERAWHAGRSSFDGRQECNDYSVGIELEGCDTLDFERQQYQVLAQLTCELQKLLPAITAERIIGHQHIAPERKTDPGPCFDWDQYRKLTESLR
jgi:AmpD protein